MELSKVIESRRSIRAYKAGAEVERAAVEEIIAAALEAPSWKNSETGRYYIAISPEKLEEVKNALPAFNQNNVKNAGFDGSGNAVNEAGDKWGAHDLGLQNENLLLKASELGLDTLIMGIRDTELLRKAFNIPPSQEIMSVIALGYRDKEPVRPVRKGVDEVAVFG